MPFLPKIRSAVLTQLRWTRLPDYLRNRSQGRIAWRWWSRIRRAKRRRVCCHHCRGSRGPWRPLRLLFRTPSARPACPPARPSLAPVLEQGAELRKDRREIACCTVGDHRLDALPEPVGRDSGPVTRLFGSTLDAPHLGVALSARL